MKLYLYDGLDKDGKATYQRIEIDESEADRWVQIDYAQRRQEKGNEVTPRTAQQIMDEMNADHYNSDRRYWYLQDKKQTVKADEGFEGEEEVDRLDLVPDDTFNPEKILQGKECQTEAEAILAELFSSITEIQKRRVIAHYIAHKTLREIAKEEGVDFSTVRDSLNGVQKALKKISEKFQ